MERSPKSRKSRLASPTRPRGVHAEAPDDMRIGRPKRRSASASSLPRRSISSPTAASIGKSREHIISSPTVATVGKHAEKLASSPLAASAAKRIDQIKLLRADEPSAYLDQLRKSSSQSSTTRLRLGCGDVAADTRQRLFAAERRNQELESEILELRKAAQNVLNDTVQISSLETTRCFEQDAEIVALRQKLAAVENSAAGYITGLEHQLEQRDILLESAEQRLDLSETRIDDLERIADLQEQRFNKDIALSEATKAMQGLELKTQLAHVEREARHLFDEAESRRQCRLRVESKGESPETDDADDDDAESHGLLEFCPFSPSSGDAEVRLLL